MASALSYYNFIWDVHAVIPDCLQRDQLLVDIDKDATDEKYICILKDKKKNSLQPWGFWVLHNRTVWKRFETLSCESLV